MLSVTKIALTGVSLLALSTPALSQEVDKDSAPDKEIVVTGTLIKGVAPVGSQSITLGQSKIEETGAISSNALLASLPQVTNYFNRVPVSDLAIAVNQIQISRPNIRNISGNSAASSATLILVDGHRIATAGVNQASVDPDVIPTGAIERVDVVTEGGSATYGADAVAGTINFITRKKFDGVKVDAHFGIAKSYSQWDASITAGKTWETGSAYISYTYSHSDALWGRDRSYVHNLDYSSLPYKGRDTQCANPNLAVNVVFVPANFTLSSVNYAAPAFAPGTVNSCDNSQNATFVPRAERHGAIIGLNQELGENTTIDIRGFYSQRKTRASSVLSGVVNVGPTNPYAAPNLPAGVVLGGGVVATRAAVSFNLLPSLGLDSAHSDTRIKEGGVNAELTHKFGENWEVRGLLNWSASDSSYELTQLSPSRLAVAGTATTASTAFNPFVVTNNNAALITDLTDSEIAGRAKDNLFNARLIADGKLFELPGGDVRIAVGYEFMHDSLQQQFSSDVRIGQLGSTPVSKYSRDVHSLFGELNLPLISNGHGGSMLTASAAVRYDHYSDFGSTTNPKIGVTFKPVDWIGFRGNWGTSFTAPTPLDQLGSQRNTISSFPFVAFLRPGDASPAGAFTVALQGSQPNLQPQTATTWSIGFDANPPIIPGLRVSLSYYDVNFKNILRTPTPNAGIFTDFPNNITSSTTGVTAAQLTAFGALAPGGDAVVNQLITSGTKVYELVDFRTGNFGILHVKGIDLGLSEDYKTSWGGIDMAVNGLFQIKRDGQVSPTSAIADDNNGEYGPWNLQTVVGMTYHALRAQVTWNHSAGYAIAPTTSVPVQTRVGAFNTVNLFFKYDMPETSNILRNLSLTLNVDNVADQAPPILLRNNPNENGFANGFTLGRMFIFGISKKF